MSPRFSERLGLVSATIQTDGISEPLRNSLWNYVGIVITASGLGLRIVEDDLWQRVKERLDRSAGLYARQVNGKLLSRPRLKDESAYLLTGFARCSVCGGPVGTDLRGHGSRSNRQHIPNYACLDHKRRGAAICTNRVGIPQEALDNAILNAVCDVLDEGVLDRAVDLAFAELTAGVAEQRARHAELEGELSAIQTRIDRLLDALADGSVPRDEVAVRLNAEKVRKDALTSERARLSGMLTVADLDTEKIKADLHSKVSDVKGLLGRQVPQARQMLRKLLADKIDIEPVGSGRQRGFKFRGALTVDRLISGDTIVGANNTPVSGGPKGIRHPLQLYRYVALCIGGRHEADAPVRPAPSALAPQDLRPTICRSTAPSAYTAAALKG